MTNVMRHLVFAGLIVHGTGLAWGQTPQGDLPKVVLVGDSIRMSYAPLVEKELAGKAVIISAKANGGDSNNVLKNLDEWVIRQQPAVVHFNCGIHDTKKSKTTGRFQVPPEQYEANLRKIVDRIRSQTKAVVLFATTTPILDDRAAATRGKADYALLEASIEQYNAIARKVMQELNVPIDDLHAVFPDAASRSEALAADGVHFTAAGQLGLAKAVAAAVAQAPARPEQQQVPFPVRDFRDSEGGRRPEQVLAVPAQPGPEDHRDSCRN